MINKKQIIRRQALSDLSDSSLHPLINKIYANRGINSTNELNYSLNNLPNPDLLSGMSEACKLLYEAILADANVLIVGDYDVDGASSTTVTKLSLESFGFNHVAYFVPDRLTFGYGLSSEIVEVIRGYQPDIVITVDNGISSYEGIKLAHEYGMSVIVTDHHLPGESLPEADVIINPNLPLDKFPAKSLAGVGVAFYLMLGLRSFLREQNWFSENNIEEPSMVNYLDLVALGTIADVVPFDYVNRLLVYQGLRRIRNAKCSEGIKALARLSGCQINEISSTDVAFKIAPKINAAGRLEEMSIGVECLLSKEQETAHDFAEKLDEINEQRKIEQSVSNQQAVEEINIELTKDLNHENKSSICLYRENWHPGIVGLIASRLKDSFNLPSIIFADDNDNLKGSARSVSGIHIRDILATISSDHPDLISKFGGHAMAAGLTIGKGDLNQFQNIFDQQISKLSRGRTRTAQILSDGELGPEYFDIEIAELIQQSGPWGADFVEPLFDGVFIVSNCKEIGKTGNHLHFNLLQAQDNTKPIRAVAFNVNRYFDLSDLSMESIHAVYQLDINRYNNSQNLQMIIDYFEAH